MTGLEKILMAIESEATSNADALLKQAQREADDILATAKAEAEKKSKEIAAKSEADVKASLSRSESAASLQERKIILDAKQQIISNVITNARLSLAKLSDSEYMDIILRMVRKYAHNKPGKILFTATDKNRLSGNYSELLQKALADKPGATLTVSEETVSIDGGFILKYGDIEENCSFDALFAAAKEDLQDKVNAILFE